jgi:hypothetical protein
VIAALARFAAALRDAGVEASPAELVDAARAVEAVGIEDRERFRSALRATLAKGRRARAIFDDQFERFFAAPAIGGGRRAARGAAGGPAGERRRTPPPQAAGGPGQAREARQHAPFARRPGTPTTPARHSDRLDIPALVEHLRERGGQRFGRFRAVQARDRRAERDPGVPARRVDLTRKLPPETERLLAEEIPRIVEEIRLRRGRRRRAARRGTLAANRMFRRALGTGGVPFDLPRRAPRPRRSRILLVIDVSWSVAAAAGYFLWIAKAVLDTRRRARILAFVDTPTDVTRAVARWDPARTPFRDLLAAIPELGVHRESDYGKLWFAAHRPPHRPGGRDTVMVVLGDARVNRNDPMAWAFEDLARRCRAVLWLVPEPHTRWGTGDSALAEYLPWTDLVVEAHDLEGLADGVTALVRRS